MEFAKFFLMMIVGTYSVFQFRHVPMKSTCCPISMQVLNYGQALFEGMKAQRTPSGEIVLFRPTCNAERMREGAARMSMVAPPEDLFLEGVMSAVRENAEMVPPLGKGSLYLRPLLLGTGPIIGLGPSSEYMFMVFGTAVGAYFKVRFAVPSSWR